MLYQRQQIPPQAHGTYWGAVMKPREKAIAEKSREGRMPERAYRGQHEDHSDHGDMKGARPNDEARKALEGNDATVDAEVGTPAEMDAVAQVSYAEASIFEVTEMGGRELGPASSTLHLDERTSDSVGPKTQAKYTRDEAEVGELGQLKAMGAIKVVANRKEVVQGARVGIGCSISLVRRCSCQQGWW